MFIVPLWPECLRHWKTNLEKMLRLSWSNVLFIALVIDRRLICNYLENSLIVQVIFLEGSKSNVTFSFPFVRICLLSLCHVTVNFILFGFGLLVGQNKQCEDGFRMSKIYFSRQIN